MASSSGPDLSLEGQSAPSSSSLAPPVELRPEPTFSTEPWSELPAPSSASPAGEKPEPSQSLDPSSQHPEPSFSTEPWSELPAPSSATPAGERPGTPRSRKPAAAGERPTTSASEAGPPVKGQAPSSSVPASPAKKKTESCSSCFGTPSKKGTPGTPTKKQLAPSPAIHEAPRKDSAAGTPTKKQAAPTSPLPPTPTKKSTPGTPGKKQPAPPSAPASPMHRQLAPSLSNPPPSRKKQQPPTSTAKPETPAKKQPIAPSSSSPSTPAQIQPASSSPISGTPGKKQPGSSPATKTLRDPPKEQTAPASHVATPSPKEQRAATSEKQRIATPEKQRSPSPIPSTEESAQPPPAPKPETSLELEKEPSGEVPETLAEQPVAADEPLEPQSADPELSVQQPASSASPQPSNERLGPSSSSAPDTSTRTTTDATEAVENGDIHFNNPILTGFNPDPTICVVPATATTPTTYYLSTSTFEYFPGCPIYKSTDLFNWKLIGHALTRRSQLDLRTVEPGAGCWASTLRYHDKEKRWYLCTGVFTRYRPSKDERIFPRGFYVYTDDIEDDSKWSDPIYFDNPGFDQDLFWDSSGTVWLSTTMRLAYRPPNPTKKDFAIHISSIDLATGRTLIPPAAIRKSPHGVAEGSHIIRRGDYYYLFTAEGGTEEGHREYVFRSRGGVLGGWEEQGKPLWYNGPKEEVQRTGHADVFEDGEGRWWAVFLGVRPVPRNPEAGGFMEPQLGRETFLVKVDWVDDWPIFNDGNNVTVRTKGREPVSVRPRVCKNGTIWKAALGQSDLELGWYMKNTPLKKFYSLTERPGHLRLWGGCYNLSSPESPAMLLRKQTSYNERFETKMRFVPRRTGYEAGLVLWWSQFKYAAIGVTLVQRPSGRFLRTVQCRTPTTPNPHHSSWVSHDAVIEETDDVPAEVHLQVTCEPTLYRLRLSLPGNEEEAMDVAIPSEALTVAPPVGGAFTGMMYGIYSFGKGEPVLDPADFSDIVVTDTSTDR